MKTESFIPLDEAQWLEWRVRDITSTDASALFGISPYLTPFELWHRKKEGTIVTLDANERMTWGTRLQDAIAAGIAEDEGWKIRRMNEYVRIPDLRMGASFDFEIASAIQGGLQLLEIKNVDSLAYKDGWLVEGDNVEAPPHIELQVQHQLAVSGRRLAYIGALIGGNKVVLIRRDRDEAIIAHLKNKIAEFWTSIDINEPPKPDFKKDAEFIAKLYNYAEPGKIFNAVGNDQFGMLMMKYKNAQGHEKEAKEQKDSVKAEILTMIGDSEKVLGDTFTISAGVIGPAEVPAHTRTGYRNFRASWKKVKA